LDDDPGATADRLHQVVHKRWADSGIVPSWAASVRFAPNPTMPFQITRPQPNCADTRDTLLLPGREGRSDMATTTDLDMVLDRFAITDVVNRYFELVNSKRWELMDQVLIEGATAQETADRVLQGRSQIVESMRAYEDSEEIVLYDHVGSFTPVIDGDTAEADVRVRSMHHGVGPRGGKSYESLAIMSVRLVRTPEGWRFSHYDWRIVVGLGTLADLYAPELERMGRRIVPGGGSVPVGESASAKG